MTRLAARSSLSKHLGGAQMQFLDGCQPRQPERFACDHDSQRQRRDHCKAQSEEAQALAARKQILDQIDDAEARCRAAPARRPPPRTACPSESRAARKQRRVDRHRQQRGVGLRRDLDRAAGGAAGIVRIHHDHAGIVELEGRRPPMRRFSLIAVGLRSGTGGRGQGGCEATPARRRRRAQAAAAGSAGSGNRPCQKLRWRGREMRRP